MTKLLSVCRASAPPLGETMRPLCDPEWIWPRRLSKSCTQLCESRNTVASKPAWFTEMDLFTESLLLAQDQMQMEYTVYPIHPVHIGPFNTVLFESVGSLHGGLLKTALNLNVLGLPFVKLNLSSGFVFRAVRCLVQSTVYSQYYFILVLIDKLMMRSY